MFKDILIRGHLVNLSETINTYFQTDHTPTIYDFIEYIQSLKNNDGVIIILSRNTFWPNALMNYSCYLVNDITNIKFVEDGVKIKHIDNIAYPDNTNFICQDTGVFKDSFIDYNIYMI